MGHRSHLNAPSGLWGNCNAYVLKKRLTASHSRSNNTMVRVKNGAEGIGLGAETAEEKVEQIPESTFGTKRRGKIVEFSIKRGGKC